MKKQVATQSHISVWEIQLKMFKFQIFPCLHLSAIYNYVDVYKNK